MRWKTTLALLVATVGIGAYLSLYELRQPSPEEREQLSKQVVNVPPDAATQLVVDAPQAKVTLTRRGNTWALSPAGFRADGSLVNRILSDLSPLTAERVLSGSKERPLDLKAFGLDPAAAWVSVVATGTPTTFLIGETTALKGNRYLKVTGRAEVFVVSSALLDDANQPAEKFRDPFLLRVDTWQADRLTVAATTQPFSVAKTDAAWHLTEPLADLADRSEINALLGTLSDLAIKRFVEDAPQVEQLSDWGLDNPKAEIAVHQEDGAAAGVTLFFGAPVDGEPSLLYAKRSDEPPLYAVAAADVEAFLRNPQDLRARACVEFFSTDVKKVEVARESSRWTMERTDGQWKAEGADAALDSTRVDEFLRNLSGLRIGGFLDDTPADLAQYGLNPPAGAISVWTIARDEPQRLLVGAPIESSEGRYGRIEGRAPVVTLPAAAWELLSKTPDQLRPPSPQPVGAGTTSTPSAPTPSPSLAKGAPADETEGAEDALQDGGVDEDGEEDERPPEEIPPERPPREDGARRQSDEEERVALDALHEIRPLVV